ncbi:MAG: hypothetical protein K9N55_01550, partial [Phycisphaerae bacterium]|nr:hypothetical protein [Phycisphaerae bacterium]
MKNVRTRYCLLSLWLVCAVQISWAGHYIAPLSTHDFSSWRSSTGDWDIAGDVQLAPDNISML